MSRITGAAMSGVVVAQAQHDAMKSILQGRENVAQHAAGVFNCQIMDVHSSKSIALGVANGG